MSRLAATVRHLLAELLRAQRALVPAVLFLAVVGVVVAGDHDVAPGPWTASVLLVYPTAAWIGCSTANLEPPEQRRVTVAAAGGHGTVAAAATLGSLAVVLPLVVVAVLAPVVLRPVGFPVASVVAAALAHAAVACTGLALGLACARPLIARVGRSFAVVSVIVLSTVGATWLPPVGVAAQAVTAAGPTHAAATLPVLGGVGVLGLLLLALATLASWAVARRT